MPVMNSGVLTVDGLLDILEKTDSTSEFFRAAAGVLDSHLVKAGPASPAPVRSSGKKFLTIGMATYDDYDGVYFSVQAIRLYHPEITSETEILVIDNHPGGPCSDALKGLESHVSGLRYVPFSGRSGTAIRDLLFREADSEFVLVMDSHVLFAPGCLSRLISFLKTQPDSRDLWQGPLLYDNLTSVSTHFRPEWSTGMYGVWDCDKRGIDADAAPFEIAMQGLGVFSCRRDAWVGFNPRLRGFGGEEGFIHEKVRQNGGKVICLPFLRWAHRFGRPMGPQYSVSWNDRIRNYLIEYDELGLNPAPAIEHFEKLLGPENARPLVQTAQQEIAGPFHFFDAIYCLNLDSQKDRWEAVNQRFEKLGIAHRVQRFPAIETPPNHHVGCALSHRSIIAEAKKHGFRNVLVFEDDVVFAHDAMEILARSIRELTSLPWNLFYLGGHAWGQSFEKADGCSNLEIPGRLTCTHAIAYHESIYDRVLADVPDTATAVALWLRKEYGIDQYFSRTLDCLKFVASPVVATQPSIMPAERRSFEAEAGEEVMQNTFTLRALEYSITVIADCEQVLQLLQTYLLPSLPRVSRQPSGGEIVMKVCRRKQGYQLACDRVAETSLDHKALIVEAIRLLDEAVIKRLTGMAAVHAGVVKLGDQAVLLPGRSNSGKSALVAELLRKGAEYLSDEYALIDSDGRAHPYPRPLLVRNSGPEQIAVLPEHCNARISATPVPVGWILALQYHHIGRWHITPVPQSEALLILLRNTPHALMDEPRTFTIFERASWGARCYQGYRSEARSAAESVLRLVGG